MHRVLHGAGVVSAEWPWRGGTAPEAFSNALLEAEDTLANVLQAPGRLHEANELRRPLVDPERNDD